MENTEYKANLLKSMFRLRNEETIQKLAERAEIRTYRAGEKLYEIGTMHDAVIFHLKGISQGEYFDEGNHRHVILFAIDPGYPLVTPSSTHRTACQVSATTDIETLEIPLGVLAPVLEQDLELLWVYNQLMNWVVIVYTEVSMMLRMSAAQRYAWLVRTLPGVNEKAAAKDIASFLGMTPETLSRLRKQYAEEPLPRVTGTAYDPRTGRGMSYQRASARSGYHQFGMTGLVEDLADTE